MRQRALGRAFAPAGLFTGIIVTRTSIDFVLHSSALIESPSWSGNFTLVANVT